MSMAYFFISPLEVVGYKGSSSYKANQCVKEVIKVIKLIINIYNYYD
jgi:hypothetical protein